MRGIPYMNTFNKIKYTLDYEPADTKTLEKMISLKSPFIPRIKIEGWDFEDETLLSDTNIIINHESSIIWMLLHDRVYKIKLFHMEPVTDERYGYQLVDFVKISDLQYLIIKEKVGLDFGVKKADKKQYIKMLGQNPKLALSLGLI